METKNFNKTDYQIEWKPKKSHLEKKITKSQKERMDNRL